MNQITAVYFSPTGRTQKGVLSIARALDDNPETIDLTTKDTPKREPFGPHDLVVFGAPVYAGRLPSAATNRISMLHGDRTPCIVTVLSLIHI